MDTLANIEMNFKMLGWGGKEGCKVEVVGTHAVGAASSPMANGELSKWDEMWEVSSCGTVCMVPVTYTPDGKGTGISVSASGIKAK